MGVKARIRLALVLGSLVPALTGCSDGAGGFPLTYSKSADAVEKLADKPGVQTVIATRLRELFGEAPDRMRIPTGMPIPEGGARLAAFAKVEANGQPERVVFRPGANPERREPIAGGFAIYREQCMHCHGASGDGNGPTAPFLWPPPRDYRPGVFKFTSTSGSGADSKPTRADLRRTVLQGIAGTSMPAFESLLTPNEIEQVIDYVMFLSIRGEVESGLVYLGQDVEDSAAEADLGAEAAQEVVDLVFSRWTNADANVLNPKVPRTESTPESIARGRELFLGGKGLQCYGCHGLDAKGNGESFVDYRTFVKAVFEGNPSPEKVAALKELAEKENKKWGDDWGDPLRPGNLTAGQYKGGRRPIDIYWRIAKGINGTPMPVHLGSQLTSDEEVWDLVNFVLALPYDKGLLEGAKPVVAVPTTTEGVPAPAASAAVGERGADTRGG